MSSRMPSIPRRPRRANRNQRISAASQVQRPLPSVDRIHSFRQLGYSVSIAQVANATSLGSLSFILTQATNYSGFADLYDTYRVDYLEYTFRPLMNAVGLSAPATTIAPRILTVIDYDDNTTPTLSAMLEYSTLQMHTFQTFTRRIKPCILTGAFNGTTVTASVTTEAPWLDCAVGNIPHYGLKYAIDAGAVAQTLLQTWVVDLFVGLSFKNVR